MSVYQWLTDRLHAALETEVITSLEIGTRHVFERIEESMVYSSGGVAAIPRIVGVDKLEVAFEWFEENEKAVEHTASPD